jgi:Holliday junction DNA helicase RuvA
MHTPERGQGRVSGSGRADKAQVGAMVTRILRLDARPEARGRRRRAGAGHHPHLARRRPGPHRRGAGQRPERGPMIAFVRGQVAAVTLSSAVLEVGGVGLELMCTPGTLATLRTGQGRHAADEHGGPRGLDDPVRLPRRDEEGGLRARTDRVRRRPEARQAMLAVLSPDDLRLAVAADDVKTLTRVPGIGQKVAQRIILELGDRLGAPLGAGQDERRPTGRRRLGAPRSTRGSSASAGRPVRPSARSTRWPTRRATIPTSAPSCGPPSRP